MRTKTLSGICAVLLTGVLAGGVCAMGFASRSDDGKWFGNFKNVKDWHWTDIEHNPDDTVNDNYEEPATPLLAVSAAGIAMHDETSYEIPAAMTFVTSRAASGVTLSASLSNDYIRGEYAWSFEFENPSSEWATGKSASDYIRLTVDTENSENATVMAIKAFSEPIVITSGLVGGNGSSATCKVDYLRRVSGGTITCTGSCEFGETLTFYLNSIFDTGTVCGDITVTFGTFASTSEFNESFANYLKFDVDFQNTSLSGEYNCTVSDNGFTGNIPVVIDYSMFIKNFDGYSEAKKEAVYYAWWMASQEVDENVAFIGGATYFYNGVEVGSFNPYIIWNLTGEKLGSQVSPNVNLNNNIVL